MPKSTKSNKREKVDPKPSSYDEMAASNQRAAILELGRTLVTQLGDEGARDLTASWMANHLAEVMLAAETDSSRMQACYELILDLWRVRRILPGGDPLERYNKILQALNTVIGTKPSTLELIMPSFTRQTEAKEWSSLARRIQRHVNFLSQAAVDFAIEQEGLRRDDFLDIAHTVDADPQIELLVLVRNMFVDDEGRRVLDGNEDGVAQALNDLQQTLDDYRNMFESQRTRGDEAP